MLRNPFEDTGTRVDGMELYEFFALAKDNPEYADMSVEDLLRQVVGLDEGSAKSLIKHLSKLAFGEDKEGNASGNVSNMKWDTMMETIQKRQVYMGDITQKTPQELEQELADKINNFQFEKGNRRGQTFADVVSPKLIKRRTEKFKSRQPTRVKEWQVRKFQHEQKIDEGFVQKHAAKQKYRDEVAKLNAEQKANIDNFCELSKRKALSKKEHEQGIADIKEEYKDKRAQLDSNYKAAKKNIPKGGRPLRGIEKHVQQAFGNDNEMFSIIPLWVWLIILPVIAVLWYIVGIFYVMFA